MSKKLLFIEDHQDFAKPVALYLRQKDFLVTHVGTGKEGWQKLLKNTYDLVILDLGLPGEDGLKLCQKIREKKSIPILILTARDEVSTKVSGFNLGADDYLVKPVSLKELVARINRLVDKDLKDTFRSSVFQFDTLKFDTVSGQLISVKKSIQLTKKEKAILEYFLLKKGRVLTRMELMDHIWGEAIDACSNTVNMAISSLRKKLRQLSKRRFIHSIHGLGYKFEWEKGSDG